jgi:hypothetical protein
MDTLHQAYHTVPVHTPWIRLIRQSQWIPPASGLSHSPRTHSLNQIDQTVPVDTPSLRLIEQSQWTLPASDWSYCLCGHPTISDWSDVAVDILNSRCIIHIELLTISDWLHVHIGPPASYWGHSPSAPYNLRLLGYSQWTPPASDWSESRSGHLIHLSWSDIHSVHPHPQTDQTVPADTAQPQTDQQSRWTH